MLAESLIVVALAGVAYLGWIWALVQIAREPDSLWNRGADDDRRRD